MYSWYFFIYALLINVPLHQLVNCEQDIKQTWDNYGYQTTNDNIYANYKVRYPITHIRTTPLDIYLDISWKMNNSFHEVLQQPFSWQQQFCRAPCFEFVEHEPVIESCTGRSSLSLKDHTCSIRCEPQYVKPPGSMQTRVVFVSERTQHNDNGGPKNLSLQGLNCNDVVASPRRFLFCVCYVCSSHFS